MTRASALALLCFAGTARASGPLHDVPIVQDTSLERYVHDLVGADDSDRLYAVRVLHRRVREAWRLATRDSADISVVEARQTLTDFDRMVAPKCVRQLAVANTVRPCASILGMLETQAALQPLKTQLGLESRRRNIRALNDAITRIEGAQ